MDEQLRKLLLIMLSSDQPGEIVNAAAMVRKLLKKNKHDVHWLADRLLSDAPKAAPKVQRQFVTWPEMLVFVTARVSFLNPREQDFIESITFRFANHDQWEPSDKQLQWLVNIYLKLKEYYS